MSESLNTLDLYHKDELLAYLRTPPADDHTTLWMIGRGVCARIQQAMGRTIRSRTYTHDGTTLPRLSSYGGVSLVLPQRPVTSITSLKIDPDDGALTEGWDDDFNVEASTGIVTLRNGYVFHDRPQVVEITYVAGYQDPADVANASQSWVYGYDEASADIKLAALQQTKYEFEQWKNGDDAVLSRSEDGSSVTFAGTDLIPKVQAVVLRHGNDPSC